MNETKAISSNTKVDDLKNKLAEVAIKIIEDTTGTFNNFANLSGSDLDKIENAKKIYEALK